MDREVFLWSSHSLDFVVLPLVQRMVLKHVKNKKSGFVTFAASSNLLVAK